MASPALSSVDLKTKINVTHNFFTIIKRLDPGHAFFDVMRTIELGSRGQLERRIQKNHKQKAIQVIKLMMSFSRFHLLKMVVFVIANMKEYGKIRKFGNCLALWYVLEPRKLRV